jgi:ankyrin repeat protein
MADAKRLEAKEDVARRIFALLPPDLAARTREVWGECLSAALVGACISGSVSAAALALESGANPNAVVTAQDLHLTPLVAACEKGQIGCVGLLLSKGANANAAGWGVRNQERKPLFAALVNRNDSIAALLVTQGGADVCAVLGDHQYSPLMTACHFKCRETTRALLKLGATVNAVRDRTEDPVGKMTVLMDMCLSGDANAVAMLLEAGADVEQEAADGATALFFAAQESKGMECVRRLLKAGADPKRARHDGATALFFPSERGDVEMVACLLEHGADASPSANARGMTPIDQACSHGRLECVRLLLRSGAAADGIDRAGRTPLMNACAAGHVSCAEALISAGCDVDMAAAAPKSFGDGTPDWRGFKALTFAAGMGHLACVQVLRMHGAAMHGHGPLATAVDVAEHRGHPQVAAWLQATAAFCTPLHFLELISADRARELVRAGADLHARDRPDSQAVAAQGDAPAPNQPPSPLERAQRLLNMPASTEGGAQNNAAAAVVVRAAEPWSPASHALFPTSARERAVTMLKLGYQLARRFAATEEQTMIDVWLDLVLPRVITRDQA